MTDRWMFQTIIESTQLESEQAVERNGNPVEDFQRPVIRIYAL